MTRIEICSYCRRDYLRCECENFHPNIVVDEEIEYRPAQEYQEVEDAGTDFEEVEEPKPVFRLLRYPPLNAIITGIGTGTFELTKEECKILCKFLEKEHIPYRETELHEILNRLFRFVEEEE